MIGDVLFGVGLDSITESLYLDVPMTENIRAYNIIVNPENPTYIIRKTVIINSHEYPVKNIPKLLENECRIISRIYLGERDDIEYCPYFLRLIPEIVWNGEIEDISDIFSSWSYYSGNLHFPKTNSKEIWKGKRGESDFLGFLLHQVGVHVFPGPYQDLDLVKINKGRW